MLGKVVVVTAVTGVAGVASDCNVLAFADNANRLKYEVITVPTHAHNTRTKSEYKKFFFFME
jgi:nicotinamidase-related amidase